VIGMSRKENYRKWFFEGLTYRLGDIVIGFIVGFLIAFYVTHDYGDALAIGSGASIVENALNYGFYWVNRWLWSKTDKED